MTKNTYAVNFVCCSEENTRSFFIILFRVFNKFKTINKLNMLVVSLMMFSIKSLPVGVNMNLDFYPFRQCCISLKNYKEINLGFARIIFTIINLLLNRFKIFINIKLFLNSVVNLIYFYIVVLKG